MTRTQRLALGLPAFALLVVVFAVPVARMIVLSFKGPSGGVSAATYSRLFGDGVFTRAFVRTLLIGAVVTAICVVLALPLAWTYVRARGRVRAVLLFAIAAPLLINMVVRTYGWTIILGPGGFVDDVLSGVGIDHPPKLIYNDTGVIIGMVHVFLPFMVLPVAASLMAIDRRLYEAGAILGASTARIHRTITLPLARTGIMTGCIIVFALSQGAFVTPLVLGGTSVQVTATLVYTDALVLFDLPSAVAIATVLLAVVAIVAIVQLRLGRARWTQA